MITFVFVLILCAVSYFLIVYGTNHAKLWNGKIDIREPSVRDLEDISSSYVIDQYVKHEIITYYNYRTLVNKVEKWQDNSVSGLLLLGSPLCFVGIIAASMFHSFPDFSKFWAVVISIAISLAITVLCLFVSGKFFPSPQFGSTEQDLIKEYKSIDASAEYPISERAAINNFICSRHHWFVFSIHNSEQTRHTLKIIGCILMLFTFILFTFIVSMPL